MNADFPQIAGGVGAAARKSNVHDGLPAGETGEFSWNNAENAKNRPQKRNIRLSRGFAGVESGHQYAARWNGTLTAVSTRMRMSEARDQVSIYSRSQAIRSSM